MLLVAEKHRQLRIDHFFKSEGRYYVLVLAEAADYLAELYAQLFLYFGLSCKAFESLCLEVCLEQRGVQQRLKHRVHVAGVADVLQANY